MNKTQKWLVFGALAFLIFVFGRAALFQSLTHQNSMQTQATSVPSGCDYEYVENGLQQCAKAIIVTACYQFNCYDASALVSTVDGVTQLKRVDFPNGDDETYNNVVLGDVNHPTIVKDNLKRNWEISKK